jgi:hypothetical protein
MSSKQRCGNYRGDFSVPRPPYFVSELDRRHPARNFNSATTGGMMGFERE